MGYTEIEDLDHFNQELGDNLTVIDFWAPWCGPCRRIAPEYESMSREPQYKNVSFWKVDVTEADDVSNKFSARALPTFVFMKDKQEIGQFAGADMDRVRRTINRFLNPTAAQAQAADVGGSIVHQDMLERLTTQMGQMPTNERRPSFHGTGNRLGGDGMAQWQQPSFDEEEIFNPITVDASRAVTKIQVQMANGDRVVQEFNHTHDVADLYLFVGARNNFKVNFELRSVFHLAR